MAIKFDDIVVYESPDVSINFQSNFYYMPEIGGNSFSNIESIKTSILSNNKYNMKLLERNIKQRLYKKIISFFIFIIVLKLF